MAESLTLAGGTPPNRRLAPGGRWFPVGRLEHSSPSRSTPRKQDKEDQTGDAAWFPQERQVCGQPDETISYPIIKQSPRPPGVAVDVHGAIVSTSVVNRAAAVPPGAPRDQTSQTVHNQTIPPPGSGMQEIPNQSSGISENWPLVRECRRHNSLQIRGNIVYYKGSSELVFSCFGGKLSK